MTESIRRDVPDVPLSTHGMSPHDRGRVQSHLAKPVRHNGAVTTYRELYARLGKRVEHHPKARETGDRYRLITDYPVEGGFLQIPKLIHDAALAGLTYGPDEDSTPYLSSRDQRRTEAAARRVAHDAERQRLLDERDQEAGELLRQRHAELDRLHPWVNV